MIYYIVEHDYCGFRLELDAFGIEGWSCVIGDTRFQFPHQQAAQNAIREILEGSEDIIKKHGGVAVRKVGKNQGTKSITEDEYEAIKKKARE